MKTPILWMITSLCVACHSGKEAPNVSTDSTRVATTATPTDTLATIVAKVQQQSRLYAADCLVHKVVLFTDKSKIDGGLLKIDKVGHRKIAIPIDVSLKGYIDFSNFSAEQVKREGELLVVTLPDPKIILTASKIDFKQARQYVSLTRTNFSSEEVVQLAQQGVDSIRRHASTYGIVEMARTSAARTIVPIVSRLGFPENNVVVRFRKEFNATDWQHIVTPLQSDRS